jgi:hypothetical protein
MMNHAWVEENAMKMPPLVKPTNVLIFLTAWLQLPIEAFRPPFQGCRHRYQAELVQSFKHYQLACQIQLPTGQAAFQLRQQRLFSLVRKLNSWMALLTEAALAELTLRVQQLSTEQSPSRFEKYLEHYTATSLSS